MQPIKIMPVGINDILGLRHRLLRPDRDEEEARFTGDGLESTIHIGLFAGTKLAGCLSLFDQPNGIFDEKRQYQMRGLAVEKEFQRQGLGKALVKYAEFLLLNRNIPFVWLNARTTARVFYEKLGYHTTGDEFDIYGVCKHIIMSKTIEEGACACNNAENKTV